jgi:hypothetical protein
MFTRDACPYFGKGCNRLVAIEVSMVSCNIAVFPSFSLESFPQKEREQQKERAKKNLIRVQYACLNIHLAMKLNAIHLCIVHRYENSFSLFVTAHLDNATFPHIQHCVK